MTTAHVAAEDPWIPHDTFGARLALIRQHMRWNVTQAATACGLGDENWRKWERGTNPQKMLAVVEQIAGKTGCDRNWLMWGSGGGTVSRFRSSPRLGVVEGGRRSPAQPDLFRSHLTRLK